jgi:hypothetical protein
MNPTLVVNALNLNDRLIERRLEHTIVATSTWVIRVYSATQCLSPEAGSLINVGCVAIDQQRTESGMMHGLSHRLTDTLNECQASLHCHGHDKVAVRMTASTDLVKAVWLEPMLAIESNAAGIVLRNP